MSFSRLILRSLVCNALMRHPYDDDDVTMAGPNVFDSRMDPIQFDGEHKEIPTILVYTDEDEATLQNIASNDGPYRRHVDLRIEIAVGSFQTVVVDEREAIAFGLPETDAMLEAKMDLFEQQIMWSLRFLNRPATNALKRFVVRTNSISSHPFRDESGNNRLALRRLHFRMEIHDDCPPPYRLVEKADDEKCRRVRRAFLPDDFPVSDWLKCMLVSIQNMPSMGPVVSALAGHDGDAQTYPLLQRLGVSVDYVQPAADPYLLEKLKKKQGPDGRIEIQCVWELSKP